MKRIRCANCGVEASVGPRARRLARQAARDAMLAEAQRREHLPEVAGAAAGTGRCAAHRPLAPSPTATRPGTAERVAVYAARVRAGVAIWHHGDYAPAG